MECGIEAVVGCEAEWKQRFFRDRKGIADPHFLAEQGSGRRSA
jgi:hypothetical protein